MSTLEQQYMSETLQSNKSQSTRSQAKHQAHPSSSTTSPLSSSSSSSISSSSHSPPTSNHSSILSQPKHESNGTVAGSTGSTGSGGSGPSSTSNASVKRRQKLRLSSGPSNRYKLLQVSKWYVHYYVCLITCIL